MLYEILIYAFKIAHSSKDIKLNNCLNSEKILFAHISGNVHFSNFEPFHLKNDFR